MTRKKTNGKTSEGKSNYDNTSTFSLDYCESFVRYEYMAAQEFPQINTRVSLHVHSRRHRLVDIDNINTKAVLDALVHAKILQDDSSAFIKEISFSQEKVPKQEEETILEFFKEEE